MFKRNRKRIGVPWGLVGKGQVGIKGKEPQERQATWSGRAKAQRFSLPQPLASTPRFTVFSQVMALLPDTKSILSYV